MNDIMVDLGAITARAEAATDGPWESVGSAIEQTAGSYETVIGMEERGTGHLRHDVLVMKPEDAEFIARARQDIPALLTLVKDLTEQLATAPTHKLQVAAAQLRVNADQQARRSSPAWIQDLATEK
jgi:hypothetical protein